MAEIILDLIQIKRGSKANMPSLLPGEPYICTDTKQLAFGTTTDTIFINLDSTKTAQLERLGISESGNLTIDDIEFVGGGSYDDSSLRNEIQSLKDRIAALEGNPPPPNTAPSVSSSFTTNEVDDSTSVSIPYTVNDVEGGNLTATFTIDNAPTTETIQAGSHTWNVGTLSAGAHVLKIKVADSGGLVSSELTFNINVTETNVPPVNAAPSISSNFNTTEVNDSKAISIPYTVTDAEGGSIVATYSIDGVPSTSNISIGNNTWSVGLLSVGSHTLTIQVRDNGNLNSNTLTFNVNVITSQIPDAVTNLQVTNIADESVILTWTGSSNATSYDVLANGELKGNVTTTTYSVEGLTPDTLYTFVVRAKNASGISGDTSISATTLAAPTGTETAFLWVGGME